MTKDLDQLAAQIRWQAEAALNGFGDMSDTEALSSALYSLERIIDALDSFDNADGVSIELERSTRDKGSVSQLDAFKAADSEPLRTPSPHRFAIRDHNDGFEGHLPVDIDEKVRFKKDFLPLDCDDNVLSFFDRAAKRILR